MRIESTRELKSELLEEIVSGVDITHADLSVGIAPGAGPDNFKLAIRVRSPAALHDPVIHQINRRAAQETDIRITEQAVSADLPAATTPTRTLRIGASVAHFRGTAGSLGFFARRVVDDAVGIVSCNHVLAFEDRGAEGDEILHPAPADGGNPEHNVVAYLDGGYARLQRPQVNVDCAFARMANAISIEPSYIGPSEQLTSVIAEPSGWQQVEKVGRTTGRTRGRVTAYELDNFIIEYTFGAITFNGLIEVEAIHSYPFTRPGDSGALVFTTDYQPIGIVCLASGIGGHTGSGLSYVNPIKPVLRSLGVEMLV